MCDWGQRPDWGQVYLDRNDPIGDRFKWIVLTHSGTVPIWFKMSDWGLSPIG